MYPRNSATPPRIAVGPVVLIATGEVQVSDVLIKVTPEGGAAGAGSGTTSYVEGIVHYTPTQAETNYTAFTVTAYKADCIPASVTVVTTASATPGIVICPDTQKVDVNTIKNRAITCGAAVTVHPAVGTDHKIGVEADGDLTKVNTLDGHTPQTGDVYAQLPTNFADMVIEPATRWTDIVLSAGGSVMTITSATGGFTEAMVGRYLYIECAEGFGVSLITDFTSANVLKGYYLFAEILEDTEEGGPISGVTGILGGRALLSENTHRPQDQSTTSAHTLLSQRLLGTIAAGTHVAQTGDGYAVVAHADYGNAKLVRSATPANALTVGATGLVSLAADQEVNVTKWGGTAVASANVLIDGAITAAKIAASALDGKGNWNVGKTDYVLSTAQVTALVAAIEAEIADDATGEAIKQAIIDKLIENLPDIDDLTLAAIGTAARDAILNRVLSGNHDTAGTLGKLAQKLAVAGTLANTDNADSFKADVAGVPDAVKVALEASGGLLKETHTAATETLPTAIAEIEGGGLDAEGMRAALGMAEANLDEQIAGIEAMVDEEALATAVDAKLTEEHGGGSWQTGGDTGSGANTVTITVDDGTNPLESVKVRVSKGAESYLGTTNASGVVVFALDTGTWTVRATLPLYTMDAETLVVDGTEAATYSMSATSITTSEPGFVTGYLVARDNAGEVEQGVEVEMQFVSLTSGTGTAHDTATRTATSGVDGVVAFTGLVPGATYRYRRGSKVRWRVATIASDATGSVALPDAWGSDE